MTFTCNGTGFWACNDNTVKFIHQRTKDVLLFLQEVSYLTEAYILDYFVEELWTKVPSCWCEVLEKFDVSDLAVFLTSEEIVKCWKPWPLSLLALRACVFSLSLPRKSVSTPEVLLKFLSENFQTEDKHDQDLLCTDINWSSSAHEFNSKSCQHKDIPAFCRRHVKPKKQHEMFRIAKVVDIMMSNFHLNNIMDIGSGLGHLSRFLNLAYNYNVATVEADNQNVSGAAVLDKQAYCSFKKIKKREAASENFEILPQHVKETINFTSAENCLQKVIEQTWCSENISPPKFALLGLHTCGSLAESVLKTFANCKESQVLILVGCCYMKKDSYNDADNYPLSSFIKSLPKNGLSYEAKELACHAIEMYIQRLHDNAPSLKIHCYRATLEKCIRKHHPTLKHLGLRGVKHAESLEFKSYAEQALSRVDIRIPEETLTTSEITSCLTRWKEVLIFYSLRLMIAPVIETLILLDRLLYLYEKGCPCCVAPIFDPSLSPRNFVLLSAKVKS